MTRMVRRLGERSGDQNIRNENVVFMVHYQMRSLWLLPNSPDWKGFRLCALFLLPGFRQRCGDCSNRTKQDERVVPRWHETSALPELSRFVTDGVDHQRPTADQSCRLDASLKGMFHQTCADASPRPFRDRGKLAEEKTGHRIRRLPGTDRARQDRRNDGGRRQAVVADDAPGLVDDQNRRETFLLIGKRARLQPTIERRFSAGKFGNIVRRRKRFWSR